MCHKVLPRKAHVQNTLLIAIITIAWHGQAYTQNWISYSMADGLSDNQIAAIIEDDHSKIWVGTGYGGLNQFDGRNWMTYSRARGDALVNDLVTAITKDREGNLWIGTWHGFSKIDPDADLKNPQNWRNYDSTNTQGGLIRDQITAIVEDDSGNVWFGTSDGLSVFMPKPSSLQDPLRDGNNWMSFVPTRLPDPEILALAKDRLGKIWVGTGAGAYRYDPRTFKSTKTWDLRLDIGQVTAIFADSYGYVWFGRFGNAGAPKPVARVLATNAGQLEEFILASYTVAIDEDSDGKIWFGTADRDHGVFVVDPITDLTKTENWFEFTQKDGLADNGISAIFRDSEGDMWVGTADKGISRYDISWRNFSGSIDLDFTNVPAIMEDNANKIWFGTQGKGLRLANLDANLLLGKNWSLIRRQDKALASNSINVIFKESTGNFWIGTTAEDATHQGLNFVNPSSDLTSPDNWLTFTVENSGLADNTVQAIAQDRFGYLWFGTKRGLNRVHIDSTKQKASWTKYDTSDGLASNDIRSILIDTENYLWLGTAKGLNRTKLEGDLKKGWEKVEAVGDDQVNTIFQDLESNIWIGTQNHGVYSVNPMIDIHNLSNWKSMAYPNGLASNTIRAIVQPWKQEYWFATSSGLTRLRVSGIDSLWTIFKAEDGPRALSIWAAYKDRRGDLWFGTGGRGVTRHRIKTTAPETFITSKLDVTTEEDIFIQFKGADRNTSAQQFRYSFKRDDQEWSPFIESEVIALSGLTEGPHTFYVRAIDMDGNIDPTPAMDVFYKINLKLGGKVTFTGAHGLIGLYFPPDEAARIKEVNISWVPNYVLNDSLVILAYDIHPDVYKFRKPVTLTISFLDTQQQQLDHIAIFRQTPDSKWNRIGGSVEANNNTRTVKTTITELGRYAVRRDKISRIEGVAVLDTLNIQPRIFSPTGGGQGHGDRASISFHLTNDATATIKIYNVAGRLKRILQDNISFHTGRNAIEWDGRDDDGKVCVSGLYIVVIEVPGEVQTKTVVVLNK